MRLISNRFFNRLTLVGGLLSTAAFGVEPASDWHCEAKGAIRYELEGQKVSEGASYCWSGSSKLMSYGHAKASAVAKVFEPFRTSSIGLYSQYGNPDFHLCLLASGAPKFIDFKTAEGWKSTSICEFEQDGSFASIAFWKQSSVRIER